MCNYSNASELFSRLTPEVKELTKKLMIDNLDVIEALQKNPIGYSSEFSKIMGVMSKSFEISEEDMTNIYMKCLNNGASKEEIISALQQYMPEEERKGFEERIDSANIYPNPKYFWLTDKNLRRIRVNRGENRGTIKGKIQADGRCFSTRVKTDMVGESKEGKGSGRGQRKREPGCRQGCGERLHGDPGSDDGGGNERHGQRLYPQTGEPGNSL